MGELYVKKMTEDVYLLDEDHAATGYLVVGSEKACVIDTMNGACDLYEEVRKLTDKPLIVVNTHGHPDHIFGNMYFDNALLNPADLEIAKFFAEGPEFVKILEEKNRKMPPFEPIFEGDIIDLGNRHLKVYELPGHTPGGIVLLLEEERILFTGDGINHHLWMQLDHSAPMSYFLKSLDRIMFLEKEADRILHGHARDFDDISLMRAVRDGVEEICNEETGSDPDYQYFGGKVKQHPFKCPSDKVFQQPDHVICYNPEAQVPKRVYEMRRAWAEGDSKRDEGLKAPETIKKFRNIMYGTHCFWNLMDLYIPKDRSKNAGNGTKWPVIISIHGGGWFYGDKELYSFYCMHLAEFGFAVVNFNYRLAPENHFPSPIEDIAAVFNWVSDNAEKYDLDKNNIFMTGDSAGAQLVSQMACIVSNPGYASLFDISIPKDLKFNAVSLACGIYSFPSMEEKEKIAEHITDYLEDISLLDDPRTKVLDHITDKYPPAFVFSSYCDFLYSACEPMSKLISSRGAESEYEIFGSPDRMDIGHVFHVNMKLEEGERANRAQIEFFKKHMAKTKVSDPIMINNVRVKNRITFSPTVKFDFAGPDGKVTEKHIKHYTERAEGGVGLICVEATAVEPGGRFAKNHLGLWEDSQIEGHKLITKACHENGVVVIIQLNHTGITANPDCGPAIGPSAVSTRSGNLSKEMSVPEIKEMQDLFVNAAIRAKKAGYDGIQLHGCHGYLINQFVNRSTNLRTDKYGGSAENRARFAAEILERIKKECGEEFILSVRTVGADPELADAIAVAEEYVKAGCNYLQVSHGMGEAEPGLKSEDDPFNNICAMGVQFHKKFGGRIPTSCANGILDPDLIKYLVENNLTDTVDLARAILADPAFPNAVLNGTTYTHCFECPRCQYGPFTPHKCPAELKRTH